MNMKDLLAYSANRKAIKVAKWNLEKDVDCSPLTDKEWIYLLIAQRNLQHEEFILKANFGINTLRIVVVL